MSIADNYRAITDNIRDTALKSGKDPDNIKIVTVTKTIQALKIQEAINSGISIFGENKVQEARDKIPELTGNFSFHLIGHLQSNKAREAVKLFALIHSIDKLNTAQKINSEAEKINKKQKILVQVNTSFEDTKSGVAPGMALELCRSIIGLENIELLGLMTIAPFTDNENLVRKSFKELRRLLDNINSSLNLSLEELSMGMSSDYTLAVEEGATMVRIGTAIMGERVY